MDIYTVSCLRSNEIDFISRLYMALKNYSLFQWRKPKSLIDVTVLHSVLLWMLVHVPKPYEYSQAWYGQSGLCFVASALGSEWQCLAPSSSPMLGDYQRQNGVCVHRVNTRRYLCRLTHKKSKEQCNVSLSNALKHYKDREWSKSMYLVSYIAKIIVGVYTLCRTLQV